MACLMIITTMYTTYAVIVMYALDVMDMSMVHDIVIIVDMMSSWRQTIKTIIHVTPIVTIAVMTITLTSKTVMICFLTKGVLNFRMGEILGFLPVAISLVTRLKSPPSLTQGCPVTRSVRAEIV